MGFRPLTDNTAVRPQSTIQSLPINQSIGQHSGSNKPAQEGSPSLTMSRLDSDEPSHMSHRTQYTHSKRNTANAVTYLVL